MKDEEKRAISVIQEISRTVVFERNIGALLQNVLDLLHRRMGMLRGTFTLKHGDELRIELVECGGEQMVGSLKMGEQARLSGADIIQQGKMRVTVVCDGSLNIRRSAAWGNDNICGRAIRGQSYYVKEIHVVDGKKMVRTIGDLYLSGESEHVQFEQL